MNNTGIPVKWFSSGLQFSNLKNESFPQFFLFGNPKFPDNINSDIFYAIINFIESTNRFSGSIYD